MRGASRTSACTSIASLASRAGDSRLQEQAALALADLGLRVDRLEAAEQLYALLGERARAARDASLESLAHYGLGDLEIKSYKEYI